MTRATYGRPQRAAAAIVKNGHRYIATGSHCPCCGQSVPAYEAYISVSERAFSIGGVTLIASPQAVMILERMMRSWPAGVSVEGLIRALYPNPDREPGNPDGLVRVLIGRIRKSMRDANAPCRISTVQSKYGEGGGYRLEFDAGFRPGPVRR